MSPIFFSDENVQRLINRIQPFEQVEEVTNMVRTIGFSSINFDLIYGLPGQSDNTIEATIEKTINIPLSSRHPLSING